MRPNGTFEKVTLQTHKYGGRDATTRLAYDNRDSGARYPNWGTWETSPEITIGRDFLEFTDDSDLYALYNPYEKSAPEIYRRLAEILAQSSTMTKPETSNPYTKAHDTNNKILLGHVIHNLEQWASWAEDGGTEAAKKYPDRTFSESLADPNNVVDTSPLLKIWAE